MVHQMSSKVDGIVAPRSWPNASGIWNCMRQSYRLVVSLRKARHLRRRRLMRSRSLVVRGLSGSCTAPGSCSAPANYGSIAIVAQSGFADTGYSHDE